MARWSFLNCRIPHPQPAVRWVIRTFRPEETQESPMLKQLQEQIERLQRAGATYVDARWHPVEEANYLMMWNGNLKSAVSSRESGVGVRALYKGAWGFSASSDVGQVGALFDKAFDNARVAAQRV